MTRTDVHRPAEFDPVDYRVIDYLDVQRPRYEGGSVEAFERHVAVWRERIEEHFPGFKTGGAYGISKCNHCGHNPLRWVAVVEHVPTGAKLAFGEICADRVELTGRDKFRAKFIHDRAKLEKAALEKAAEAATFAEANGDVVEFLAGLADNESFDFLVDIAAKLTRYGTLSDAQCDAVRRIAAKRVEQAAKRAEEDALLADAADLAEGRYEITGEVLTVKWQDSMYGGSLKMLVKLADGNKVWGTVPGSITGHAGVERGDTVTFTATVTRSNDDSHFGFFKRPAGAKLLKAVTA